MSRIFVHGLGAVSPAGWGVAELGNAVGKNVPLPFQNVARPGEGNSLKERIVPPPPSRPAFLAHPRLRRATSLAQHAVGAALEAIGSDAAQISTGNIRLGIVAGVLSGCINYSRRFYEEVLREPGTASPLIFPETVFNSPASHLAAFLGTNGVYYTMVGDNGTFLQGLALATQWLEADRVDACVVIGMEESDWITADALGLFQRKAIHASGAGAVYLTKNPSGAIAELTAITDSFSFTYGQNPAEAAKKMRADLPPTSSKEVLCDSTAGLARLDAAENAAWQDWPGARISPKTILGEAFVASAAWQCVIACDALARGNFQGAQVSVVGVNQQAIGARFARVNP